MSHFGPHWTASVIGGIGNNLFNGSAAVIGFFVISGLCIHWPHAAGSVAFRVPPFYLKRLTRIAIPLFAAIAAGRMINQDIGGFYRAILWSLIAEIIYYTAYPVLLGLFKKFGISAVIVASYCVAVPIICANPHAANFHDFGPRLTWLIGLPAWLLGCRLAEVIRAGLSPPCWPSLWTKRGIVWALSAAASILRFHGGVGYPITLTLLGPLLYLWLKAELSGRQSSLAPLERLGAFSYSIYLTHGISVSCLIARSAWARSNAAFPVRLLVIIVFSYLFSLTIERPSQSAARSIAGVLR
jgi:peptidoglycan/LPS O-acetylase OafA/YrhL